MDGLHCGKGENHMHAVPDIITASRIIASLCLLAFAPFSVAWFALYAWCGISDVLDGLLARRMGAATPSGARFDSAADVVLVFAVALSCAPALHWQFWMAAWIVVIFAIRMATLVVCRIRFGRFSFVHTWANKATGAVLFLAVAVISLVGLPVAATVCCGFATLSSIEELILMARMPVFDADCKGACILFS